MGNEFTLPYYRHVNKCFLSIASVNQSTDESYDNSREDLTSEIFQILLERWTGLRSLKIGKFTAERGLQPPPPQQVVRLWSEGLGYLNNGLGSDFLLFLSMNPFHQLQSDSVAFNILSRTCKDIDYPTCEYLSHNVRSQ